MSKRRGVSALIRTGEDNCFISSTIMSDYGRSALYCNDSTKIIFSTKPNARVKKVKAQLDNIQNFNDQLAAELPITWL